MRSFLLSCLWFVGCGALAGWLAGGLLPPVPFHDELTTADIGYREEHGIGAGAEITDGRWRRVLRLMPDFDLSMDVELGASMDLDLLVRHVEPRPVRGERPPFTERFVVLRLTTGRDGPAWLTREQALFGERGIGASLAPGIPATVWVQGRGRLLRANVAGRWTPWFEAEDTEGMFALVAHRGTAVLQRLVIDNRGASGAWLADRSTWLLLGAAIGLLLAAVAALGPVPWSAALCLGGFVVAFVAWQVDGSTLQPLRVPPSGALLLLLTAPAAIVVGILVAARARGWPLRVAAVAITVLAGVCADGGARELLHSDTRRVDALFGPQAGNQLSEALAQLVRGPFALHGPHDEHGGVFLLGGALPYGRLGPKHEHLEPLLLGELRRRLGRVVPVVGLPTEEGQASAAQQWELFARFFTGFRPRVIVFGVPVTDGDREGAVATLQATLRAARAHAAAHGAALVLFADAELAGDLMAVLRTAERDGVAFVVAGSGVPAAAVAEQLATAIAPLLR